MNILMFNNGDRAKLADFGLARKINSKFTKMTKNIATDDYAAPEVKHGEPEPFKSDMYSLGLILHFMLTRTLPSYRQQVKNTYSISTKYSKDIVNLMSRLLQEEPEVRPDIKALLASEYVMAAVEKLENTPSY